jgi:methyl-accepting chemotaxis protein
MRAIWKLALFMLLLISFYIGFGIVINWQLSHIASLVQILHDHSLTVARASLSASRDTIAISRNAKDMVLGHDKEHLRNRLTEIEFYEKNITRNMDLVLEKIQGEEGRQLTLEAIELLEVQRGLRKRMTDAIFAGQFKKADDLARLEGIPLMEKIEAVMSKITNYAQANSMKHRVESINALRHSKIILFSAGLIIILLSLFFSLLIGGWLIRAFARSKNAVLKAAQIPIDLTMTLKPNILGGINVAINTLFTNLHSQMSMLAVDAARLEGELAKSEFFKAQLPERINQIAAKLKTLIKKTESLPADPRQ